MESKESPNFQFILTVKGTSSAQDNDDVSALLKRKTRKIDASIKPINQVGEIEINFSEDVTLIIGEPKR